MRLLFLPTTARNPVVLHSVGVYRASRSLRLARTLAPPVHPTFSSWERVIFPLPQSRLAIRSRRMTSVGRLAAHLDGQPGPGVSPPLLGGRHRDAETSR